MSMSGDFQELQESTEIRLKKQILKLYRYKCIICRRHAEVLHEMRPRSLGGKVSLENSVPLCFMHHDWAHRIGTNKSTPTLEKIRKQRLNEYEFD